MYPDPDSVLRVFESAFGPGSGDPEVSRLLSAARSEADLLKRQELYVAAEEYILEHALALPLLVNWADPEMLVQPWVHDFNMKRFGGSVFQDVWFDDTAPDRALP